MGCMGKEIFLGLLWGDYGIYMDLYGFIWIYMDLYGFIWIYDLWEYEKAILMEV